MSTTTIVQIWNIGSPAIPTDLDAPPTLATNLIRTDTSAIVVASGTTLTRTAVGTYTLSFADPAQGLTYTYSVAFVYLGNTYTLSFTKSSPLPGIYDVNLSEAVTMLENAAFRSSASQLSRFYQAIQISLDELLRLTYCNKLTTTLNTVIGQSSYDLTQVISNLRASRLVSIRNANDHLRATDFNDILYKRRFGLTTNSCPKWYAHEVSTDLSLYPAPDAVYPLGLVYWSPLIRLVDGSTILNVPREYISITLATAGVAALLAKDPDDRFQQEGWKRFMEQIVPEIRGDASLSKVFRKSDGSSGVGIYSNPPWNY